MIGTMFLWMFWPSFNSAPALDDADVRHRTVINTILSMAGSCVAAFVFTFMFHKVRWWWGGEFAGYTVTKTH